MIISDPDPYLLPTYRMSPFTTADVHANAQLPVDVKPIQQYLNKRFSGRNYAYMRTGKTALFEALSHYNLESNDVVTILTTTDNFYISSCVTKEIEKFCIWSREIEPNTKVLLVNHEFGYPRKDMKELQKLELPIIEDCAYAFFSEENKKGIGHLGDFTIYSFPKIFPIQLGGLLTAKKAITLNPNTSSMPNKEALAYMQTVLSEYIMDKDAICRQRRNNYTWLIKELKEIGCEERLPLEPGVVPGACLFKVPPNVDLPELKTFLWSRGIQCSVFYGEQTFFVPIHQRLKEEDIAYIKMKIQYFINKSLKAG